MSAGSVLYDGLKQLYESIERLLGVADADELVLSYLAKRFKIASNDARIRNDDLSEKQYRAGDAIPNRKKIGDPVLIPQTTQVQITRTVVQPAADPEANAALFVYAEGYGWTAASNLEGGFRNETFGIHRPTWLSEDPAHKTVGDPNAVIRKQEGPVYVERKPKRTVQKGDAVTIEKASLDGAYVLVSAGDGSLLGWLHKSNLTANPPAGGPANRRTVQGSDARVRDEIMQYNPTNGTIPQGDLVIVKEYATGARGERYARVASVTQQNGTRMPGPELGWTSVDNLVDGWADFKGPNSAWRLGRYIGQVTVVDVQGTLGPESVALHTLAPYQALVAKAAASQIDLTLNDGFRIYAKQEQLYQKICVQQGKCDKVARPGRSNHQHGQALDLRTDGFDTPIYNWLKEHAREEGWIRTVDKEPWHWEHRPADVAKYPSYKLPSVNP